MPWSIPQQYTCPKCHEPFESTSNRAPQRCPTCRKQHNHKRTAENYRKRREGGERVYWSSSKQRRKYSHLTCTECGALIWTSSNKGAAFVCISCKRALGLTANGREGRYTTLATPPAQVLSFGRCERCGRDNQELANKICPCCRFYNITEIDPDLSERARGSKGGRYDFIRHHEEKA